MNYLHRLDKGGAVASEQQLIHLVNPAVNRAFSGLSRLDQTAFR